MALAQRPYPDLVEALSSRIEGDRMQVVADALWDALAEFGVSWVGFYLDQPGAPDDRRLVLGPHRNRPACSPIGLGGVCGESLTQRRTIIVDDVASRGDAYIACDPRDRSEIVLPLLDADGTCKAVLDLDSHELRAFDDRDDAGLRAVLEAAGLSHPR